MDTITVLRTQLQERGMGAELARVSTEIEDDKPLTEMTLSRLARGLTANPGIETIQKVERAIAELVRRRSVKVGREKSQKSQGAPVKGARQ